MNRWNDGLAREMLVEADNAASQCFQKNDFAKAEEYNTDALLLARQVIFGIRSFPKWVRFFKITMPLTHISKLMRKEFLSIFSSPRKAE